MEARRLGHRRGRGYLALLDLLADDVVGKIEVDGAGTAEDGGPDRLLDEVGDAVRPVHRWAYLQ